MAREVQTLEIREFSGLDTASPLLQVDAKRAIDILNMIRLDEKSVQSRKPWEQIGEAPEFTYNKKELVNGVETWVEIENPRQFNGLWDFTGEDGKNHVIAHIGNILFELDGIGQGKSFQDIKFYPLVETIKENGEEYTTAIELVNDKTKAVASGNRLYIMGGLKYLCLRFNKNGCFLDIVEDSELVYVPVTSTGGTYTDSPVNQRTQLDKVNLLSSKRKNKLLSGTLLEGNNVVRTTRFFEYSLDADIDDFDDSLEIELKYKGGEA